MRPIMIGLQKGSQYTFLTEARHQIDGARASIVGRNPIISNRLSSSLCSRRIGAEMDKRHNITTQLSSALIHCFPA